MRRIGVNSVEHDQADRVDAALDIAIGRGPRRRGELLLGEQSDAAQHQVSAGYLNKITNGAAGKGFVSIAPIGGSTATELVGISLTVRDSFSGAAHVLTTSNDSATLADIVADLNAAGAGAGANTDGQVTAYVYNGSLANASYASVELGLTAGESLYGGNTFSILLATDDPQYLSLNFSDEIGNLDGITSVNITEVGVVPEPTSVGLMAVGTVGLLGRRRHSGSKSNA